MIMNYRVFIVLLSLLWILLFMISSTGLFTVDELLYLMGIDSFAENKSLVIENGYDQFKSDALRLWFLKQGPNGLTLQYPSGYSIIAYPFYLLGGVRGVMAMNMAAAITIVVLTYYLANEMFGDKRVAVMSSMILALCSFIIDYAVALWPHALATLTIVATIFFIVKAVKAERGDRYRYAFCSGVIISIGLMFRVDVVFVLPALILWVIFFTDNPVKVLSASALGMLPGVFVASFLNYVKFGVFFPVSYGSDNGHGTDVFNYVVLAVMFCSVTLLSFFIKKAQQKNIVYVFCVFAVGMSVLLLFPYVRSEVLSLIKGFYVLGIDLREYGRIGIDLYVVEHAGGMVTFSGVAKKALAQSLPWVGVVCLIFMYRWNSHEKRMHLLVLFLLVCVFLPFARSEWHGGFSNNMRYFLGLLPFLSIWAAFSWYKLVRTQCVGSRETWCYKVSAVVLILSPNFSFLFLDADKVKYFFQQQLPWTLFLLLVGSVFIYRVFYSKLAWSLSLVRSVFVVSLLQGFVSAYAFDININHSVRKYSKLKEEIYKKIPDNSLVYTDVMSANFIQAERNNTYIAFPNRLDRSLDYRLVNESLESGRRVFVEGTELKQRFMTGIPDLSAVRYLYGYQDDIWELKLVSE